MLRKRFAATQQWKKGVVAIAVAERARRRSLSLPAWEFGEAELAALQPFSGMASLEDNLEEDLMRLVEMDEEDARWLGCNGSNSNCYRY